MIYTIEDLREGGLRRHIRSLRWVHTQFARRECLSRHTFRVLANFNASAPRFKFANQTPTILVFGNGILDGIFGGGRIWVITSLFGFRDGVIQFLVAFACLNQEVANILDSVLGNINPDFGSVAGNIRGLIDGGACSGSQKRERLIDDRREDIRDIFE